MNLMLCCLIFPCISAWPWCSAAGSSLAFLHELDAPLLDLLLHFYSTWTWCSAAGSSLAFQHELDAPPLDLLLHFCMNLMLRCLIFSCMSTWTWCFAAGSSLACLHELDMLRRWLFSCISTWTWCSAAWSSLAFLHELDAPPLPLLLHFNMNLMLRCLIFSCISTWTWCSAAGSSLAFQHELDAPPLNLLLHVYQCCWRCSVGAVRPHQFLKELAKLFPNKKRWVKKSSFGRIHFPVLWLHVVITIGVYLPGHQRRCSPVVPRGAAWRRTPTTAWWDWQTRPRSLRRVNPAALEKQATNRQPTSTSKEPFQPNRNNNNTKAATNTTYNIQH